LSAVFGTLSTAPYVGALAGTALAVYVQDAMGWRWVFVPSGVAGIFVSLLVLAWLKSPSEMNVEISGQVTSNSVRQHHTGIVKLWAIPAVPELTVSVFCLKFVRYCMFVSSCFALTTIARVTILYTPYLQMWLPLYLIEYLGYDKTQGGLFSTLFDVGGILGGPLLGFVVDRYYSSRPMWGVYLMMCVGTLAFALIGLIASWGVGYCSVLLLLAGACNCGPDSLLTGSVPMTIGEKFGRGDGAGVTSLVNGLGSIGAIIEGPIIGVVSQQVGWLGVIGCMIGFSLAGTLATLKAFVVVRSEEKRRAESAQQEPV
jgi:sugar phosphate permease